MTITQQLRHYRDRNCGVAASIRIVTTMNPTASQRELVTAAVDCGFAAGTARIQFNKARREDAAFEAYCAACDAAGI